jgi:50S ribosomal subunit-associated GTPase HflX
MTKADKLKNLEAELKKYEEKWAHMSKEYAATRAGSNYGVEYYEIQCRVYQSMIEEIKEEIDKLKKSEK